MSDQSPIPKQTLNDILRVLGIFVIAFVVINLVMGSPGGLEALIALLIILAIHLGLRILVWLIRLIATGFAAFCQAVSNIRIVRRVRAPTKREIAAWFAGELKENNRMLEESPLDDDERKAGKRQAKIDYIQKMNDLLSKGK